MSVVNSCSFNESNKPQKIIGLPLKLTRTDERATTAKNKLVFLVYSHGNVNEKLITAD